MLRCESRSVLAPFVRPANFCHLGDTASRNRFATHRRLNLDYISGDRVTRISLSSHPTFPSPIFSICAPASLSTCDVYLHFSDHFRLPVGESSIAAIARCRGRTMRLVELYHSLKSGRSRANSPKLPNNNPRPIGVSDVVDG